MVKTLPSIKCLRTYRRNENILTSSPLGGLTHYLTHAQKMTVGLESSQAKHWQNHARFFIRKCLGYPRCHKMLLWPQITSALNFLSKTDVKRRFVRKKCLRMPEKTYHRRVRTDFRQSLATKFWNDACFQVLYASFFIVQKVKVGCLSAIDHSTYRTWLTSLEFGWVDKHVANALFWNAKP